jgi:ubiquinone/menaquinone biosynthesis C-methylase UbiE
MHDIPVQQRFFDELACEWDQLNDSGKTDRIETILRSKVPPLSGPILDIGSGTGILVPLLSRINGHYIFELDIAHNMLKIAKQKMAYLNHHSFVHADAHRIPFNGDRIGTVFCFCVYPHFNNAERAIGEIYRVLRKGGRLIILHLMNHQELNAMHASKNEVVAGDVLPPVEQLALELEQKGFRVTHAEEDTGLYLLVAGK